MFNIIYMLISFYCSLFAFGLIAKWYVFPQLKGRTLADAAVPLVLLHCFRHMGLVYLIPEVVTQAPPPEFSLPTAYGDLLSALLAFVAIVALRRGWAWQKRTLWLFNIVGTIDLLVASVQATRVGMMDYAIGPAYFLPILVVPALLVSHALVFILLLRAPLEVAAAQGSTDPAP